MTAQGQGNTSAAPPAAQPSPLSRKLKGAAVVCGVFAAYHLGLAVLILGFALEGGHGLRTDMTSVVYGVVFAAFSVILWRTGRAARPGSADRVLLGLFNVGTVLLVLAIAVPFVVMAIYFYAYFTKPFHG